jgi:hypothetical protein
MKSATIGSPAVRANKSTISHNQNQRPQNRKNKQVEKTQAVAAAAISSPESNPAFDKLCRQVEEAKNYSTGHLDQVNTVLKKLLENLLVVGEESEEKQIKQDFERITMQQKVMANLKNNLAQPMSEEVAKRNALFNHWNEFKINDLNLEYLVANLKKGLEIPYELRTFAIKVECLKGLCEKRAEKGYEEVNYEEFELLNKELIALEDSQLKLQEQILSLIDNLELSTKNTLSKGDHLDFAEIYNNEVKQKMHENVQKIIENDQDQSIMLRNFLSEYWNKSLLALKYSNVVIERIKDSLNIANPITALRAEVIDLHAEAISSREKYQASNCLATLIREHTRSTENFNCLFTRVKGMKERYISKMAELEKKISEDSNSMANDISAFAINSHTPQTKVVNDLKATYQQIHKIRSSTKADLSTAWAKITRKFPLLCWQLDLNQRGISNNGSFPWEITQGVTSIFTHGTYSQKCKEL